MKRKLKAQVLFENLEKANCNEINLPQDEALDLYVKRLKEFGEFMFMLALQGKLFIEQKDGITNKLRTVDPSQDSWLGRED